MPDWISHIFFALIIAEIFKIRKKSLLVLGSLLPDFITKIYLLGNFFKLPNWMIFDTYVFHFFVPSVILALICALFFRKEATRAAILIPFGVVLHLLLDSTTRNFFYTEWYNILWIDQYWIAALVTGTIYFIIKIGGGNMSWNEWYWFKLKKRCPECHTKVIEKGYAKDFRQYYKCPNPDCRWGDR